MTLTIPSDLDMAELDELQTTMQVTLNLQGVCDFIVREPSTLTIIHSFHGAAIFETGCGAPAGCAHRGLGAVLASLVNRNRHKTGSNRYVTHIK